jgi:hypothetical protein
MVRAPDLLSDEAILAEYITMITTDDLGELLESRSLSSYTDEREDEIFRWAYERLGGADLAYLQADEAEPVLMEHTEFVGHAFVIDWVGAKLVAAQVVEEGAEGTRQASDNQEH